MPLGEKYYGQYVTLITNRSTYPTKILNHEAKIKFAIHLRLRAFAADLKLFSQNYSGVDAAKA